MSALTVSRAEWDAWERERIERASAERERTAWHNKQPKGTDHLTEQIAALEDRLYVQGVVLGAALELLDTRARQHARTLELVRAVEFIDRLPDHALRSAA